ncbi:MBL fold metallo-hydrolase [Rhodocytophaga aerolata]|uniref:MBL fold metallo-hydrolase n=1 Tax=Rhodocytophaga aerolata TaxID=455078 RepID=A0ABT8RAC3_9BACT|nr:MBL fold metallo-hydrolase [Rhodocytophaga aerolata]MDO1449010.1 MBL fold metallo-hydrolase [Rhodocytophaga aerolata]
MVVSFYGAAQMVTGSKHLVTLSNGTRILLDCGMFQGKGANNKKLNEEFGFEPEKINYLILSHAHIDHSGLIPKLVKEGFEGPIFCTPPTLEFSKLILVDSARIHQSNTSGGATADEPLYTEADAEKCLQQFVPIPYNQPHAIDENIELLFTDTGHVLGSAAINLTMQEDGQTKRLCFSGDIGRFTNRILKTPQPFPQADVVICEATYGNKLHMALQSTESRLEEIVQDVCVNRKGKLIIPSFSIGRTQELIYSLNVLAEDGRLPEINVFVDSPLSVYATDIMRDNSAYFNDEMLAYIKSDPDPFGFPQLHYVVDQDDSKLINTVDEPCIIISSSGMMEAGRIRHHLKNTIDDPKNAVLITGYCEPSTLGGQLLRGADKVSIFEEELEVKAEIILMKEYSAHADFGDIVKFLFCQDKEQLQQIFLVHGEKEAMEKLKEELGEYGFKNIQIAEFRMSYEV